MTESGSKAFPASRACKWMTQHQSGKRRPCPLRHTLFFKRSGRSPSRLTKTQQPTIRLYIAYAARARHAMVPLPLRVAGLLLLLLCVSAGAAATAAEGAQATRSPGWGHKAHQFIALITATPLPGP